MKSLFNILTTDPQSKARRGQLVTEHGLVETPAFFPVGTQGAVKSISQKELAELGAQLILGNTYHLYLRPGAEIVAQAGGLHQFQSWNGALFTDSGGFQVFSLGLGFGNRPGDKKQDTTRRSADRTKKSAALTKEVPSRLAQSTTEAIPEGLPKPQLLAKVDDDGVTFRSHLDGSTHRFTPEISLDIQHKLGADIIVAFDECAPHPSTHEYTEQAMHRTHRWAKRSLEYHQKNGRSHQFLYGISQGGVYQDLRQASAQFIDTLDVDGYCVGGVSVGESKPQMYDAIDWSVPYLNPAKPRHLLGVGDIDDIFNAIERGMDTFDCVTPTRWGRNGTLMVHPQTAKAEGSANPYRLIITNAKYQTDFTPPDPHCDCWVCTTYTRAYLHHLFRSQELLGSRLASYHNIAVLLKLMQRIRTSLEQGPRGFQALKQEYLL